MTNIKLDTWERKGLFYEKTVAYQMGSQVFTRTSRLFCVTYWFLKKIHPKKYK